MLAARFRPCAQVLLCLGLLLVASAAAGSPAAAGSGPAFGDRTLRVGHRGTDVERLQRMLGRDFGFPTQADGRFGPATKRSVKRYERWVRMAADGVVQRPQARQMRRHIRELRQGKSSYRFGERDLSIGARGPDVATLQRLLTRMDIPTDADGHFGPATEASVKEYERWKDERVDGRITQVQAHVLTRRARRGDKLPAGSGGGAGGGHAFPVQGSYSFGGSGSVFGAPRSGGRRHQGQDIAAASGTAIVAVHSGTVSTRQYQAGGAGHYLVIRGNDGSDSVYMHMLRSARVGPGERVRAGQRIGDVGSTGSSTGPHLHFELWTPHWFAGGAPYDPLPKLKRWAR